MRRLLAATVSILVGVALMLLPAWSVWRSILMAERIAHPLLRPAAFAATILLGMGAFLLATHLATHVVARLFRREAPRQAGDSLPKHAVREERAP
jgi:hypothetical protein